MAVVVTTYNHAHFLREALESISAQTIPVAEVIVVDDGSQDDPAAVAKDFPSARLLRQDNRGLAAARNAGLRAATADFVLFLDADDVLCPTALEAGLDAMSRSPGAAFVYGAHRMTDAALNPTSPPLFRPFGKSAYRALLHDNLIGMHGAVLYDRAKLLAAGGFAEDLHRCEDYDVYLRMARDHPVGCHPEVVALYRMHSANMSSEPVAMLNFALDVHARNKPAAGDGAAMRAWRRGKRFMTVTHVNQAWKQREDMPNDTRRHQQRQLWRSNPVASAVAVTWRAAQRHLPAPVTEWIKHSVRRMSNPVGSVNLGDLARPTPISRQFGFDRGTPVDRYFIEAFLERHRADIAGRVLEVGDDAYSRRFGAGIVRQDVLHVSADNPQATIVGDLSQPDLLPAEAFDCMIVTQTLHLIYDMPAAIDEMWRALKPEGVLLLTVPGVSSVDRGEWGADWLWSLTGRAAERLFADAFGPGNVKVDVHGNVYAATGFLHGLALEEVRTDWLDRRDPAYPVTVTVRAVRRA